MRILDVYMNGLLAGRLSESMPGKGYSFVYDASYLIGDKTPVSVLLPRRSGQFLSEELFPFFANLLPEGANRKMICQNSHLDEKDDFGLLTTLCGADFIGAVSFREV